jgi:signal transduction histidine kinase
MVTDEGGRGMTAAFTDEAAATKPRVTATRPAAHEAPGLPEHAATPLLQDVFSFTVEVLADGFEWLYFGPNSAVLLGDQLCPRDTSFDTLLRSRSLREDSAALAVFAATAAAGGACEVELRMEGADGALRWVLWRVVPRREDGRTLLDGVATDVSSRRIGQTNHADLLDHLEQRLDSELLREHAAIVRDANDGVLQRLFAAGLRLRVLQSRLDDVGSHAAEAIAFQLDQAATDLRHTILELEALSRGRNPR